MNVKNSSVTSALKLLEESKHINYEPYGIISLTDNGEKIAKHLNSMHKNLKSFLTDILRIDEVSANETACRMEHIMPKETYKRFIQFTKYVKETGKIEWLEKFSEYINDDNLNSDFEI
jgi:Mn-dependent transcriptional regulator